VKAVLDTNVVISAFLWYGPPTEILCKGAEQQIALISLEPLLAELFGTLSKDKFKDRLKESKYGTPEEILFAYRGFVQIVHPVEFLEPPKIAHAADEKVLNAAFAGRADCIVSGDHHLLDLKRFDTIDIVTPADFLKIHSRHTR
jgi:putative PIN family toxin of toxin-antitoxin system